jgi:hypothetical protein
LRSKGRKAVILKKHFPKLMEVGLPMAEKVIFPLPGLNPM